MLTAVSTLMLALEKDGKRLGPWKLKAQLTEYVMEVSCCGIGNLQVVSLDDLNGKTTCWFQNFAGNKT